jgi:malic enzyme
MGIPIGKLALYTAGAGVHPDNTLAVSLDCGTDNEALLNDPLYLGYPKPRLRGAEYDAFIEEFVEAVNTVYPGAVLQWEDLKQHNALRLLDRYRHRLASFNDDIQGTAAVVVAGLLAAVRLRGETLAEQRFVLAGAGAAGIGIARLIQEVIAAQGRPAERASVMLLTDSHGLIFRGRDPIDPDKLPFAVGRNEMDSLGFPPARRYDLETVVRHASPTILIGTTGVAGSFTETVVREMAARVPAPIVMPLSNPTANAEATPADILAWSGGRAIVATGSPFDPVPVGDTRRIVGQANNMFIFPGLGLGAIVARTREVTDRMFLVAATTLSEMVGEERLAAGAIYPRPADLRRISRAIAVAVAREAREAGLAPIRSDQQIETAVDAAMWTPDYSG